MSPVSSGIIRGPYLTAAVLAVLLVVAFLAPPLAADPTYPDRPVTRVNDFAGLLTSSQCTELEQALADFERRTTNQLLVATFESTDGGVPEDITIRLAEKWKVGSRDNDNGLILVVFIKERKVRFEVGYGLEGALPDALANRIISSEVTPHFRQGDYAGGIAAGMSAAMRAIEGEYSAPARNSDRDISRRNKGIGGLIIPLIFILIFIFGGRRGRSALMWYLILGGGRGGFTGGRGGFGGGGGGGGFSAGGGSFGGGGATGSW